MRQEDKELLLKDLAARLPYGVKILNNGWDFDRDCEFSTVETLIGIDDRFIYTLWRDEKDKHSIGEPLSITDYKPYLRPLSSMTEEEKHELLRFGTVSLDKDSNANDVCCVGFWNHAKVQDYLNSIHIDYRGLIPKKLAIEVTEENNPYEKK